MSPLRFWLVFVCTLVCQLLPVEASQVRIFTNRTQSSFLGGTFKGISVDPLGTLRLAHRAERIAEIPEPFVFCAATHPEGWVVGTGNQGKVLLVRRQGDVEVLFSTAEPEVFAVWVDPDGTVLAGSSPKGKVYRFSGEGEAEVLFDPEETYIWGLARGLGGDLLVATGTDGKLFRVNAAGEGSLLYDSDDTHLRSVGALPDGGVLVGSAGQGLVLHVDPEGRVRTLYDAKAPEIVAFTVAEDGSRYFAALASEASFVDLSAQRPSPKPTRQASQGQDSEDEDKASPKVTVSEGGEAPPSGSRTRGFRGARSEVLRIDPQGATESVWRFENETVFSLFWQGGRLWVGTGLDGKIYSHQGDQMVLEKDVDERQVVALLADEVGPAFATTNAAALYRVKKGSERQGEYISSVFDAEQISRFGTLHWDGETPRGTSVTFSLRSGLSSEPDPSWSDWTLAGTDREIALDAVPRGRYVQWKAELRSADGPSPQISAVEISYLRQNLKPRIESLSVLDPGQILVPSNFNPSNQTYEPAHPNREGIFTTVGQPASGDGNSRLKTLWKRGYRTLRWQANDPNDDKLIFALAFRRNDDGEGWLEMTQELDDKYYSFDATVLPDGIYRFRVEASDRSQNLEEDTQVARHVSEPVTIDHSPPGVTSVRRQGETLRVTIEDELSPLREAVVSQNAGEWRPVKVLDGLLDGRQEVLLLDVARGTRLLLLRLTDSAFNVATLDLSEHLE